MNVQKLDTFGGHSSAVFALAQGPEAKIFYSSGGDGQVVQWDLSKPDLGKRIAQIPGSVYAMAYNTEENTLWVAQNNEGLHIIDPEGKQEFKSIKLTNASIFSIVFLNNLAFLATGNGVLLVVDVEKKALKQAIKLSDKSLRCLALSPDKKQLGVGCSDHNIYLLTTNTLQLTNKLEGHTNSVFALEYSPDSQYLISSGRDAMLKVWDLRKQFELVHNIPSHIFAVNHIVWNPSGTLMATASMDKSIKIWDASTFKLLKVVDKARHAGHGTSVNKLLWTSYKNQLISASDDKLVSVWEISQ
jgi:WD40 repeat protein